MDIKNKGGFTLVEMILSITLFALIIVTAFSVIGNMGIIRIKQANRIDVNQDLFYAIENLVTTIKEFGGDIDYEEYWNRRAVGTGTTNGYYSTPSGYGNFGAFSDMAASNFGNTHYYCRSRNGIDMGTDGCLTGNNSNANSPTGLVQNYTGSPQRFLEYSLQFIDYNSNKSSDLGDEDSDTFIIGDDDDEDLGSGPVAFTGNEVKELYLIRKGKINERFLLRLKIGTDPDTGKPASATCINAVGSGCLGKLQILRLTGRDLGMLHNGTVSAGLYDGVIDTWQCSKNFSCPQPTGRNLPLSINDGWVDLTPSYINVKDARFHIYPNKNSKLAWKENDDSVNINPFLRVNLSVGYSWEKKKKLKGEDPTISLTTSINLTKN